MKAKTAKKAKPAKSKTNKTKEVRGPNLINVLRSAIPGAGMIESDKETKGRKVFFEFQRCDFVVSSRLKVQECGFGRLAKHRCETYQTGKLTERLKLQAVAIG
jgi:hypothetical protein